MDLEFIGNDSIDRENLDFTRKSKTCSIRKSEESEKTSQEEVLRSMKK